MSLLVAALLGLVEGLTEFLPVSSTGHLILVGHWLVSVDEGAKSFDIVIQLGAILAVVVHYRQLFAARLRGVFARDAASLRLFGALLVAFVPAAITGLLLGQTIKRNFPLAAVDRLGDAGEYTVDVVGPLCTPLDTLARNATFTVTSGLIEDAHGRRERVAVTVRRDAFEHGGFHVVAGPESGHLSATGQ